MRAAFMLGTLFRVTQATASALAFLLMCVATAEAQRPSPEARVIAGWAGFADDGWISHGMIGGSVRYYLTRRVAVEPELLYMVGPGTDRDLAFIPHVSFDFRPGRAVRPYLIGGYGVLRHRQTFAGRTFGSSGATVNFGMGVRIPLSPRVFIAPEFRFGWEPFLRPAAALGFTF